MVGQIAATRLRVQPVATLGRLAHQVNHRLPGRSAGRTAGWFLQLDTTDCHGLPACLRCTPGSHEHPQGSPQAVRSAHSCSSSCGARSGMTTMLLKHCFSHWKVGSCKQATRSDRAAYGHRCGGQGRALYNHVIMFRMELGGFFVKCIIAVHNK